MVMDFGVAKAVTDAATRRDGGLTQLGVTLGTPAYMAPEQAAADPATDQRADIYAFGVMAYELLTGDTPFAGRPAQAMLAANAVETPEAITRRRPAVPPALGALVMHCLEKRPSDRPQTAAEIVRVLDAVPTSAASIRATAAVSRRTPGWLVGAALGAIIVIRAAAVFAAQKRHAAPAADAPTMLAVLPFRSQGPADNQYFADGLTDAITNRLSSLQGLAVIDSRSAAQYRNTTMNPKQIGRELGVQYLLEGTVQWATDATGKPQVQISPALVDVANLTTKPAGGPYLVSPADVFKVQTDVSTKVADALNVALNGEDEKALTKQPTQNPKAYDAFLRGEAFDQQNTGLDPSAIRHAMDAYSEATSLDPHFAQAFAKLAHDQLNWTILDATDTSRVAAARRSIDSALALDPDLAEGHVARAHYLGFIKKDRAASYEEILRAHALKPNDARILSELGYAQIVRGKTDEGIANVAKAVQLDPRSPRRDPAGGAGGVRGAPLWRRRALRGHVHLTGADIIEWIQREDQCPDRRPWGHGGRAPHPGDGFGPRRADVSGAGVAVHEFWPIGVGDAGADVGGGRRCGAVPRQRQFLHDQAARVHGRRKTGRRASVRRFDARHRGLTEIQRTDRVRKAYFSGVGLRGAWPP